MKSCLIKPPIHFILIYLSPDAFHFTHSYVLMPCGGPDGEIGASMRYLSQRFSMPNRMATAVLNDIATEELAHLEMVIISTTQSESGLRQQVVFLLMPVNSRARVTPLQIFTKTLQQNKKPEAPTITFFALSGIYRKSLIQLGSFVHVKLCISKDSVKHFAPFRKSLTQRTFMLLTRASICRFLTLGSRKTVIKQHTLA